MKNIVKVLAVLAVAAGFASCNQYEQYKTAPYASVDVRAVEIEESAAGTLYNLPVHIYNKTGACTLTYAIKEISAKNGVEFIPSSTSGVLEFPAGTDSLAIGVTVKGQPGTYTGNLQFSIDLVSATEGVTIGALNSCVFTVKDLDHPLSAMFGTYTMAGITINSNGNLSYPSWGFTMSAVDGDPTKVLITDITAFSIAYGAYMDGSLGVVGTVSEDHSTITIETPQEVEGTAGSWGSSENFVFYAHEGFAGGIGNYITDPAQVVFTLGEDGAYYTTDSFGFSIPSDLADYPDMFYYYAIVMSNYNANYPTYFVKD